MPAVSPFLWFDKEAEEAARFYVSLFPNSQILELIRYGAAGPGVEGSVMTVRFSLDGTEFTALNGGPAQSGFNLAVSFVISCASAEEVDHYWDELTKGGEPSACGWLRDRFGLAWQVVPPGMTEVLGDPDPKRARRAMEAMLKMGKLDLAAMKKAADSDS